MAVLTKSMVLLTTAKSRSHGLCYSTDATREKKMYYRFEDTAILRAFHVDFQFAVSFYVTAIFL